MYVQYVHTIKICRQWRCIKKPIRKFQFKCQAWILTILLLLWGSVSGKESRNRQLKIYLKRAIAFVLTYRLSHKDFRVSELHTPETKQHHKASSNKIKLCYFLNLRNDLSRNSQILYNCCWSYARSAEIFSLIGYNN